MHKPSLKYVDKPGFSNCKNQITNPDSKELKKEARSKNLHGYWKNAIAGIVSHKNPDTSSIKKIEIRKPVMLKILK